MGPKTGQVLTAKARAENTAKQLLRHPERGKGYVSYSTGALQPLSESWRSLQQTKGWMRKTTADPANSDTSSLDQLYEDEVKTYVNQPLIIHNNLLLGRPKCHNCKRCGCLEGNGVKQGTHTVLDIEGQFEVISFGICCKNCPAHNGKDYNFTTNDPEFLKENFHPAIFDHLPWQYWTATCGATPALVDLIKQQRAYGTSALKIAKHRNQLVASRYMRKIKLFLNVKCAGKGLQIGDVLQPPQPSAALVAAAAAAAAPTAGRASSAAATASTAAASTAAASTATGTTAPLAAGMGLTAVNGRIKQHDIKHFFKSTARVAAAAMRNRFSPLKAVLADEGTGVGGSVVADDGPQPTTEFTAGGGLDVDVGSGPTEILAHSTGTGTAAADTTTTSVADGLAVRGPWDTEGYGLKQLTSSFVTEIYQLAGTERFQVQRRMFKLEQACGFVSLDHVIQVAKRMVGDTKAMLIACGASGNVLDWWCTTSTGLSEVADDLEQLAKQQQQPVAVVTVDDPISMQGVLTSAFPDAEIKMDVGHVIFSRIGKLLDKTHANYSMAVKGLALCFFEYNREDFQSFLTAYRAKNPQYKGWGDQALLKKLPLSTFKRHVRRRYLQPGSMEQQMLQWYKQYVVDTAVDLLGKHIVSGGQQGLDKFDTCFKNQLQLARDGYLSDPEGVDMYYLLGSTKAGLINIKAKRGSSKNEAVNRVIEASLTTTGRMAELSAYGICSDRFTDYNRSIKSTFARHGQLQQQQQEAATAAAAALGLSVAQHLDAFEHCLDPVLGYSINSLSLKLGGSQIIPLMDTTELQSVGSVPEPPLQRKVPSTLPPGMSEVPDLLQDIGEEFDESLLADAVAATYTTSPAPNRQGSPVGNTHAFVDHHSSGQVDVAAGFAPAMAGIAEEGQPDRPAGAATHDTLHHAQAEVETAINPSPRRYGKRLASAGISRVVDAECCSIDGDVMMTVMVSSNQASA